ncbi:MAG: thioredoxin family protein [Flavobacteriaceae bacterium]|nr:thioredoxin family protein [Flavobacteriaceae bacterium]
MGVNWISTEDEFHDILKDNMGVLFYFSTVSCSVGEALEPKVMDLMGKEFPKIEYCHIDMNTSPEISANNNVFVEPTILVFFDGKETIRKSRIVSIPDLSNAINRIYNLAFE